MPKGYVIGRAVVTNPSAWAEYAAKAGEAMKIYGGTPIVRGGKIEVAEGEGAPATSSSNSPTSSQPAATRPHRNTPPPASCAKVRESSISSWLKARPDQSD
ncbi:DUF1330 domain-containing protein [Leptospira interrogans]